MSDFQGGAADSVADSQLASLWFDLELGSLNVSHVPECACGFPPASFHLQKHDASGRGLTSLNCH